MEKHHHRNKLITTIILLIPLFFLLAPDNIAAGEEEGNNPPSHDADNMAVEGVVDLADWNFEEDGITNLHGKWKFYWEELLEPADFRDPPLPQKTDYIHVPGDWNDLEVDGEELPGHGYATYRLVVENLSPGEVMGIIMPEVTTAYNLWVDDELLSVNGKVSDNPEKGEPHYEVDVFSFVPEDSTAEITLQVSNYHHRRGGHNTGMELGTAEQIYDEHNTRNNGDLFLIGCLIILALYNLGYFYYNRRDLSTLYFALFCLAIILRTITATGGEILLASVYPEFNWELQVSIEYISMVAATAFFILFFREMYPRDISHKLTQMVVWFTAGYSLFVLVTPVNIFSYTPVVLQIIALVPLAYLIYSVIRIVFIHKREGATLMVIGFAAALIGILYEALIYFYIIDADSILNYGLIIMAFTLSLLISTRFTKAYLSVETMSEQLKEYGETLEEKVSKRTEKLGNILEKLRYAIVNETNVAITNLSSGSQELANISVTAMERATDMQDNLEKAGEHQQTVSERINKGRDTIGELEQEITTARQAMDNLHQVSGELVQIMEGIQKLNNEIKSIAKQVNLLAINAGIEAARAGSEGHSFAVVAEEVKKLSEQTYSFVENIDNQAAESSEKISELQNSVESVDTGVLRTEETVETTNEVYNEIINSIDELTSNINFVIGKISELTGDSQNISAISEEQAATIQEINAQISNLVELVESLEDEDE